ncbi:hypothetical protein HYT55_01220 [Candidatus Woesearchaeota archaeon]|nr:hypothetical protein [Candidatus Woesearchaeota archaeon]
MREPTRRGLVRTLVPSEQPKYSFDVDTPQQLAQVTGDLEFVMHLVDSTQRNTDPNLVRDGINGLGGGVGYINYMRTLSIVVACTDQATYERLFQTTLEYNPILAGQNGYTSQGYKELSPARPVESLAELVDKAHLNYVRR